MLACSSLKKEGQLVIAVVYVDDALFFGKNKEAIKKVKKTFMDIWECRDLGEAREFLRMKIWHEGKKIFLDQADYLKTVVTCFGMLNAKGATTPLPAGYVPVVTISFCFYFVDILYVFSCLFTYAFLLCGRLF